MSKPVVSWREYGLWPAWAQVSTGALIIVLLSPLLLFAGIMLRYFGKDIQGGWWLVGYLLLLALGCAWYWFS